MTVNKIGNDVIFTKHFLRNTQSNKQIHLTSSHSICFKYGYSNLLIVFFDTDDGEERIWPDDQRYIERQLSGALFDDEECHFPPSQEVRFDTLGAVAARNLQGFGV